MRNRSSRNHSQDGAGEVDERYKLHGSPDSANFVVRMILEELDLDYETVPVDRSTAQHKSDSYRALNPQGLIPVLEAPGQDAPLFETAAILLFLADTHQALAPSPASSGRGRFLKWLFFLSNTLHSDLRISFKPERYIADTAAVAAFHDVLTSRIAQAFGFLEKEILATGGPYLMGHELTCADHYLAACARWAQIYRNEGRWTLSRKSRLHGLLERLEERPAVQRASALENIEGVPFTHPQPVRLPGTTA